MSPGCLVSCLKPCCMSSAPALFQNVCTGAEWIMMQSIPESYGRLFGGISGWPSAILQSALKIAAPLLQAHRCVSTVFRMFYKHHTFAFMRSREETATFNFQTPHRKKNLIRKWKPDCGLMEHRKKKQLYEYVIQQQSLSVWSILYSLVMFSYKKQKKPNVDIILTKCGRTWVALVCIALFWTRWTTCRSGHSHHFMLAALLWMEFCPLMLFIHKGQCTSL